MSELNRLLDSRIHRVQCEVRQDLQRQNNLNKSLHNKLELLVDECSKMKIELEEINVKLNEMYKLFQTPVSGINKFNKETMQELADLRQRRRVFEMKIGDYKSSALMLVFAFMGVRWILGGKGGFMRLQMALEQAIV